LYRVMVGNLAVSPMYFCCLFLLCLKCLLVFMTLISSRRYYFEILHKQDDKGSDHVEVGVSYRKISSIFLLELLFLPTETMTKCLKMNSVDHIPQTLASHIHLPAEFRPQADMLRPDPRDTFYTPMIDHTRLQNVLPACLYSPTYVVKDFPIARYQGLQFVYLSFVYPNDFTRLTHMERENKCFYRESPIYLEKDRQNERILDRDWGRDHTRGNMRQHTRKGLEEDQPIALLPDVDSVVRGRTLSWVYTGPSDQDLNKKAKAQGGRGDLEVPPKISKSSLLFPQKTSLSALTSRAKQILSNSAHSNYPHTNSNKPVGSKKEKREEISHLTDIDQDTNHSNPDPNPDPEQELEPEEGEMSDYSYEEVEVRPGWAEESINWQRTFSVNPMDFELLRSDWNDLRCNVSGNLQLAESEVVDVLAQYMEKLNEHNGGIYTLLRIINVEKRRDSARGNRYLVELELMERGRSVVRLSEYIYLLLHHGRQGEESVENTDSAPASAPTPLPSPLLCQPVMLQWRRDVMVHFVVPVKNQARWVQQFISDMENLHQQTKDDNFSIIIVDFESEDMDVEQALRDSSVYEYLRREGNFERSAGLQIGVDTIKDSHSIVFLCDLHIHFPLNILESIRKHCVEGRLAFAPIVMRLSCGSSPLEPDGYWEVNGFGLFGIYKSDFDKIGGMNTEEFKDRWGGEDWELLDRVLQNGLEVERLRLRNFFHYYHSKRGMWNSQNKKTSKG
uniref:Hexosyltransferase n=1 Tax=Xiphophorus couchianus TaxID=32473 RepID=A0A3B5MV17_9TELE